MNNVLIIGGTNNTALNVAKELKSCGYSIDCMTYRDKNKISTLFKNWMHLDLFDENSIDLFLKKQQNKKYDKIILFISDSSKPYGQGLEFEKNSLQDFYGIFCVNYLILIKDLLSNLKDTGSIIHISSSAAYTGSNNVTYSSGKALVQNYIMSLQNFLKENQSSCSISPGTILGSKFYISLPEGHPDRINTNALTSPEQIAGIIMESSKYKGKDVKIGWETGWDK